MNTGTKSPQTTPRKLSLFTHVALGLFGSRWEQLSGQFLGEVWVVTATAFQESDIVLQLEIYLKAASTAS